MQFNKKTLQYRVLFIY